MNTLAHNEQAAMEMPKFADGMVNLQELMRSMTEPVVLVSVFTVLFNMIKTNYSLLS